MNDNVDENFLRNLLMKCGQTEEQIIYRHPKTQRRLGIARIVFVDVKSARSCIEKYNQQSVMGNVMNVFYDAFGEQCKQLLAEASGDKKPNKLPMQPFAIPPISQPVPPISNFKQKDDLFIHTNESEPYFQVDYKNSYPRTIHTMDMDDTDNQRHYKTGDSRRWDSKSTRYYKNEKDRDRSYRSYRSHRDERDSGRRRDYDYERKDRDRRERDHRSRDSKYRDYKKSDAYVGNSSSSTYAHTGSHHHYTSFDSTNLSSFHQYPPLP